jgi:hypothetical protein
VFLLSVFDLFSNSLLKAFIWDGSYTGDLFSICYKDLIHPSSKHILAAYSYEYHRQRNFSLNIDNENRIDLYAVQPVNMDYFPSPLPQTHHILLWPLQLWICNVPRSHIEDIVYYFIQHEQSHEHLASSFDQQFSTKPLSGLAFLSGVESHSSHAASGIQSLKWYEEAASKLTNLRCGSFKVSGAVSVKPAGRVTVLPHGKVLWAASSLQGALENLQSLSL